MLAIPVHEDQDLAGGGTGTTLDGCAVAHGIGRRKASDSRRRAYRTRVIGGTVIHDNDLGRRLGGGQAGQKVSQCSRLVLGGQDNTDTAQDNSPMVVES